MKRCYLVWMAEDPDMSGVSVVETSARNVDVSDKDIGYESPQTRGMREELMIIW